MVSCIARISRHASAALNLAPKELSTQPQPAAHSLENATLDIKESDTLEMLGTSQLGVWAKVGSPSSQSPLTGLVTFLWLIRSLTQQISL